MTFKHFNLSDALLKAIEEKGYKSPTPIQEQAIPHILSGKDILGSAQTGTGKTAAFCIPILQRLNKVKSDKVRALILTPTRELTIQVCDNLKLYSKNLSLRSMVIFGGVSQGNQVRELRNGVDIIVATPGRLLDLMNQGIITLKHIEVLVLDEVDQLLDKGFINDIKKVLKSIPLSRQNIFFSATMPVEVQDFVKSFLRNPLKISIQSKATKPSIQESVYYVQKERKRELLKHLITEQEMQNVIVFSKTKYNADKIAKDLTKSGISAEAFHGNKSQNARQRTLANFKHNVTRVLVATDIAARGIDIVDLPFVINYELPLSAETYTHRIGRTGRAGKMGSALSFCDKEEHGQLRNINRISTNELTVVKHPFN